MDRCKRVFIGTLLLAGLGAVQAEQAGKAAHGDGVHADRYRVVDCAQVVPDIDTSDLECAYVSVRENRVRYTESQVEIFLVRPGHPVVSEHPPVVVIAGGPGAPMAKFAIKRNLPNRMSRLLGREVIYFDQRGVGLSLPTTGCPEIVHAESTMAHIIAWWRCSRRYRAADVDIHSFNTIENASDIAELPIALGVEKIDLIAGSYGTRLASEVLQQFPKAVRYAVLGGMQIAGPNPGDTPADQQAMFNRAAIDYQNRCARHSACAELMPELDMREVIIELQRLIERDGQVVIAGIAFDSLARLRETLFVMSYLGQLRNMFFNAMVFAARENSAGFYRHVGEGDAAVGETFVLQLLATARHSVFSIVNGMSIVTRCYDGDGCSAILRKKNDYPVEEFQTPAGSDHPVLIVSGDLDPATPIQAARAALPLFSNARHVVYACLGHDVARISNLANGDCLVRQVRSFLDNPLDTPPACEEPACASLPLTPVRSQLQALVDEYVEDFHPSQ